MADPWDSAPVASPMDIALDAEGATPRIADIARSIYQQESGSGKNTKTSNAGAQGGMQIIPATFHSVADKGWNISDPVDNARAGVRYIQNLSTKTDGDPALTAAGYYGGPGAIDKARKGIAVSDPRNPNAPNTLQYGDQVASRIPQDSGDNWWSAAPTVDAPQAPQDPQGLGTAPPSDNTTFSLPGQPTPAEQAAAEAAKQPKKGFWQSVGDGVSDIGDGLVNAPLQTLGDAAHGTVDALTFGLADKAGAALNAAANSGDGGSFSDRYHNVLSALHQYEDGNAPFIAGQIGSAFVPGAGELSLINKAVEAVPTAGRVARTAAGAAAGATEGTAQVLGHADNLDDVTAGQVGLGMGLGALGGSVAGAISSPTSSQLVNSFVSKAGSSTNAARDAEIIQGLQGLAQRSSQDGAKLGPADANAFGAGYTQRAADALRQMDKTPERQTLLNALDRSRSLSDDDITALRALPHGDAVADAIQMRQRVAALTAPKPAASGIIPQAARMAADNLIPIAPVRHLVTNLLGGRENRTANIEALLKQGKSADAVLQALGPSQASQSAQALAQASQASLGARAAAAAAQQQAKAQQAAQGFVNRGNQAAGKARQATASAQQQAQAQATAQAAAQAKAQAQQQAAAQARAQQYAAQRQAQSQQVRAAQQAQAGQAQQAQAQQAAQAAQAQQRAQAYAAQRAQQSAEVRAGQSQAQQQAAAQAQAAQERTGLYAAQRMQQSAEARAASQAQQANVPDAAARAADARTRLEARIAARQAGQQQAAATQEATERTAASAAQAQAKVDKVASGDFTGLTASKPQVSALLDYVDHPGVDEVKQTLSKLAAEDPETGRTIVKLLTPGERNLTKKEFYGLQAKLQEVHGAKTPPQAVATPPAGEPALSSAIANPQAYQGAINRRQKMVDSAVSHAPTERMKVVAHQMGAESSPDLKEKALDAAIAKATPEEKAFLATHVQPLIRYGK